MNAPLVDNACVTHCLNCTIHSTPALQACVCCLFGDILFISSDGANVRLDLTTSCSILFTHTQCASVTIVYSHYPLSMPPLVQCSVLLQYCICTYHMMMSYFKGTADAVAEYCTAVSCPNAPNTF